MKRYLNKFFSLILWACCGFMLPSYSMEEYATTYEYQVKAALLYNFTHYTTWPAQVFKHPQQPFMICLFGENPFQGALQNTTAEEKIAQRRVGIINIQEPADIGVCNVLFIPKSEQERQAQALEYAQRYPVLSIGETDNFIKNGGIVKFITKNNKIRFAISNQNAKRSGLKISADLLFIATIVD